MRCPRHDLALAADGTCIRCSREAEEAAEPEDSSTAGETGARGLKIAALLVAAVGVVTFAIWSLRPVPSPAPAKLADPGPSSSTAYAAPSAPPLATLAPATVPPDRSAPSAASGAPSAIDRAMHEAQITLYSRTTSPESNLARSWLLSRNYTFKEHNVDADVNAREGWMKASPSEEVPAFDVDGQGFAGFDPGRLQAALEYAGARRLQRR
jgi:hypothetical protein